MKSEFSILQNAPSDYPYELIQRCRRGDPGAQLQVYKLYYKQVFNVCMKTVIDPVVAESLMHESFLLAFENINSYIGDISFSSWVNKFIRYALNYGNIS